MADKWNIVFERGAQYEQVITVNSYTGIANATGWTVRCSMPNEAPFLTATTANGLIANGNGANQKILRIPAATTATMPLGNGRFDFELAFANGVVDRLVANGACEVVPKVGDI